MPCVILLPHVQHSTHVYLLFVGYFNANKQFVCFFFGYFVVFVVCLAGSSAFLPCQYYKIVPRIKYTATFHFIFHIFFSFVYISFNILILSALFARMFVCVAMCCVFFYIY